MLGEQSGVTGEGKAKWCHWGMLGEQGGVTGEGKAKWCHLGRGSIVMSLGYEGFYQEVLSFNKIK